MEISVYAVPGVREISTEEEIFETVCRAFEYDPEYVQKHNHSRKRELVEIRQISMYLIRRKLKMPYNKIGDFFEKDHATVLFGIRNVKNLLETDKEFRRKTNKISML